MSIPQLNADVTRLKAAHRANATHESGLCHCPCHSPSPDNTTRAETCPSSSRATTSASAGYAPVVAIPSSEPPDDLTALAEAVGVLKPGPADGSAGARMSRRPPLCDQHPRHRRPCRPCTSEHLVGQHIGQRRKACQYCQQLKNSRPYIDHAMRAAGDYGDDD